LAYNCKKIKFSLHTPVPLCTGLLVLNVETGRTLISHLRDMRYKASFARFSFRPAGRFRLSPKGIEHVVYRCTSLTCEHVYLRYRLQITSCDD